MAHHKGGYQPEVRARLDADAAQILAKYPQARSALLPLLHLVQSEDGYITPAGIAFCAEVLDLSRASVSAVATFYSQYKRRPNGEYTVGICTNTLCAVMGGDLIFDRLSEHLGIGHDETTEDGKVTLERLECNAACDFAPVMMINWEFFDNQTPATATATVDAILAGEQVRPTRGADSVVSFKEASRVLAGFDDHRADEGLAAGPATLVGLELARRNDWRAPAGAEADGAGIDPGRDPHQGEPEVGESGSSAEREPTSNGDQGHPPQKGAQA
ncbi:MAG TPA: NADH-quinone oxidoreductase subunit NuoE [Beutenbergiaceae bacterium]|nr:NADH-quinone oxidoreductase subunit NuoE [Beutenbergiaceae bacterium]